MGDDVPDRGREIPVPQRHPLGAARRPARMQHQRDVIHTGGTERFGRLPSVSRKIDSTILRYARLNQARRRGQRRARRRAFPGRNQEKLRPRIAKVIAKLRFRVGGIERTGRRHVRHGEKEDDRLRSIRKDHRDARAPANSHRDEARRCLIDKVTQSSEGEARPFRHADGNTACVARHQEGNEVRHRQPALSLAQRRPSAANGDIASTCMGLQRCGLRCA